MTLLDRFRAQPPQKHADPAVRLSYVQEIPIDERDLLAEIARDDPEARVRRAAVAKLMDPAALVVVVRSDSDESVREAALTMLRDIALDSFEGVSETESLAAVEALSDVRMLTAVAKTALREEVALRALGRVSDPHGLGIIARHAALEPIRLTALAALEARGEILNVALNSEFKDTAVGAVERLDDRADLEQVAVRAKNRSALKRARTVLREMDERAAAEAAAQPPAVSVSGVAGIPGVAAVDHVPEAPGLAVLAREEAAPEVETEDAAQRQAAEEQAAEEEAARLRAETERVEAERAESEAQAARLRDEAARERERLQEQLEKERLREEERAAQQRQQELERAEAQAREARVRQEALARLTQLAARTEPLAARSDLTLKTGERALRDVRTAIAALPPLPSRREHDDIAHRLKGIQTALTAKVQELRELTDWQRWANLGVQEQLCVKMEALAALEDPVEIQAQVRALQEQWRAASDVPRPQGDVLWRRFKAAHDVVWSRCEAHFAKEAAARAENLATKIALCEKAEALALSTQWIQTAEEIKRLQIEWKTIGAVSRGQERAIWERFRSACDRFFTRRQADLAEHRKRWAENMARKEALCVRVEALADSTDWDVAAAEIRRLQSDWKTIGPVKKSRSEAIWLRFRNACDRFFTRYAQRHEIERGERVAAREAICAELEALVPLPSATDAAPSQAPTADAAPSQDPAATPLRHRTSASRSRGKRSVWPQPERRSSVRLEPDAAGLLTAVRALRGRWQQEIAARGVDRERAAALDQRFAAAFARVLAAVPAAFAGSDLDVDANRKRMESLVRRVEELAGPASPGDASRDAALSPTTRLAAMLKEALASNTIGGKVDEESRLRAAAEEVRQAQASWARIGPVPDDVRRALGDRFSRACRKITERAGDVAVRAGEAGRAGRPGGPGPAGRAGGTGKPGR